MKKVVPLAVILFALCAQAVADADLLAEMIGYRSVSADVPEVNRLVEFMRTRLVSDGLFCRVETMGSGRKVLYAANADTCEPDVLLSAHLDVVPAQMSELFMPRVENGRMYGRGASDCKEHCVLAVRLMKELKGRVSIGCLFGSDEEMGGLSTAFMLDRGFGARRLIIVLDSEQYAITTRQKGLAAYLVEKRCPAVHTGMVRGAAPNAAVDLMNGYAALVRELSDYEDGSWRDVVSLTRIVGNGEHAEMELHVRAAKYGDWERLERIIREKTACDSMKCLRKGEAVILDESEPYLQDFRELMRRRWPSRGVDFFHLNSSTDARHLQRLDRPMLILGVDARGAHTPAEYVILSSIGEYAELLAEYLTTRYAM